MCYEKDVDGGLGKVCVYVFYGRTNVNLKRRKAAPLFGQQFILHESILFCHNELSCTAGAMPTFVRLSQELDNAIDTDQ